MPPLITIPRKQFIPPQAVLLYSLTNPSPSATDSPNGDSFGQRMAMDGDTLLIGAWGSETVDGADMGRAYIYSVSTGALLHTLENPNTYTTQPGGSGDAFGYSVALTGNYAIVYARMESTAALNYAGALYIFDVTSGGLVRTIPAPAGAMFRCEQMSAANGLVSVGVAASADYSNTIAVYDVATGDLVQSILSPTYPTNIYFGDSSSLYGDKVLVGAWNAPGSAFVYEVSSGNLLHTLNNPNVDLTSSNDAFGRAVYLSASYAVVGAPHEDANSTDTDSGVVYVFNADTGQLIHTLHNPNAYGSPSGDNFGFYVSGFGDFIIVGAYAEDGDSVYANNAEGKAYIFSATSGALITTIDAPLEPTTEPAVGFFGGGVTGSGDNFAIGAYYRLNTSGVRSGAAYIYTI